MVTEWEKGVYKRSESAYLLGVRVRLERDVPVAVVGELNADDFWTAVTLEQSLNLLQEQNRRNR